MASFTPKSENELDLLGDDALIDYVRAARDAGQSAAGTVALGILVFGHWANVTRRVALKVPARDVEDVAGEVITSAIRSAFDGVSVGEFHVWLGVITRRRIADYHRARENDPTIVPLPGGGDADEPTGPELAGMSEEGYVEVQDTIERVLARLSDDHRRVVELLVFDGFSAREAAEQVPGMTEANAHQVVSRFRKALRAELQGGDTEDS